MVEIYDLAPCLDEVLHEVLGAVGAGVDLGERAKLRVRSEHEVCARALPLDLAGVDVASLEGALVIRGGLPDGVVIEEVDEEVVGQCVDLVGEDVEVGAVGVGVEDM